MPHEQEKPIDKALEDLRKGEADLDRAEHLEQEARAEIRQAEHELEEAERKKYEFFVGADRFETPHEHLTGAQIKAIVPGWPPADGLELEGEGHESNRLIADHDTVHFKKGHPLHFIKVPPATFGGGR